MSGTRTSTGPVAAAGAGAAAATDSVAADDPATLGCACFGSETGAAGAAAAPAASSTSTTEPSLTLSPNLTRSSFTTPAVLDGISIEALSDSTVIRLCSAATVSPGLTSSSMTATSSKSPMSGTFTSTNAMFVSGCAQAYRGLILSVLMPYFLIASATLAIGIVPSSASERRAATTMK
ncbi:MAG: hypothetical protein BWX79_02873 [Alphaproteobacteria bacterium ADurb.Bin100]|nr:MAG: hypothetical protein BWX79_02873 [Alphaproteobacteria bacterium ADurb.Bin100]